MRRQISDKLGDEGRDEGGGRVEGRGEGGGEPELKVKLRASSWESESQLYTVGADKSHQQKFVSCRHRGLELTEACSGDLWSISLIQLVPNSNLTHWWNFDSLQLVPKIQSKRHQIHSLTNFSKWPGKLLPHSTVPLYIFNNNKM